MILFIVVKVQIDLSLLAKGRLQNSHPNKVAMYSQMLGAIRQQHQGAYKAPQLPLNFLQSSIYLLTPNSAKINSTKRQFWLDQEEVERLLKNNSVILLRNLKGVSFNGRTTVSKTVNGGSIPSTPAKVSIQGLTRA